MSLILFWPAAFAVSGGNEGQVGEYKRLTGEYNALQEQAIWKECNLDVESPQEVIAKTRKKSESQGEVPESDQSPSKSQYEGEEFEPGGILFTPNKQ